MMLRMAKSTSSIYSRQGREVKRVYRNQLLWFTAAAAAFSTSARAFTATLPPPPAIAPADRCYYYDNTCYNHHHLTTTRLFSSRRNTNDGNDKEQGGLLGTIKNAATSVAKSVLPSSWFQTEKEKQKAIQRQQYRDQVNGGITELLKDAPLPIRMMGKMVGPLMSSAMSSMAESLAEQQATVDEYLQHARVALQSDEAVVRALGDIQVGAPMTQSSSTQSINGQTTTRIEIGFPVTGSSRGGTTAMAQLSATEAGIQRLLLQTADGRQINVNLNASSSPRGQRKFKHSRDDDDDVIEAEIIDKKTRP